jgi:diacylglycerol O-acyltransferase / wax synthase
VERLSGLDASFLYLETPTLHMHVAMTMVLDPSTVPGGYSFERMKETIAARIPRAPVFRRRLVEVPFRLGHPVWVDDPEFDIDYHVRLAAVPRPGGLRQLADLAGDIAGHQLDRSKPLWEMWIIEGLADDQIGFVAKMHHSTVDGVSGAELLSVLFDLEPEPEPVSSEPDQALDSRIPSGLELMSQAAVARSMRPIEMTRDVIRTGHRVLNVRRVRTGPPGKSERAKAALPLSAPRTSFNAALTRRRRVTLTAIGLDDVKRIKNATGTTVNDVVLAVCAGALRSFLLDGDELPEKPLVAVVPVSVRPAVDSPKGSNQVSSMFVQLPANLHDPLDRLMAIHEGTKGAKEEHNALGADLLLNWAEYATPTVFASAARLYTSMRLADRHRPIANLVISNVPGPDFPLYLGGAELKAGFPLGPVMDGMGVNITVMSYRGVLYWGVLSCPETIPRAWDLTTAIPRALDQLLEAAGQGAATYRSVDVAPGLP